MDDGTDSKAAARRQGQTADNREAKKKRGGMVGGEEGEDLMLKGGIEGSRVHAHASGWRNTNTPGNEFYLLSCLRSATKGCKFACMLGNLSLSCTVCKAPSSFFFFVLFLYPLSLPHPLHPPPLSVDECFQLLKAHLPSVCAV